MRRSRRNELLMGVMLGVYGNWLIAVLGKMERTGLIPMFLFAIAILPFLLYFMEAFRENRSGRLVNIYGFIHFLLMLASLISLVVIEESTDFALFAWFGFAIWVVLMWFESRA